MTLRGVSILGSTGSIGRNTLRVVESLGTERFRVVALGAGRNIAKLADQITGHRPDLVSVQTEEAAEQLQAELRRRDILPPRIVIGENSSVSDICWFPRAFASLSGGTPADVFG